MKKLMLSLLAFVSAHICMAQTEAGQFKNKELNNSGLNKKEVINQFSTTNFSLLWTKTSNEVVFGFIGDKYQRIKVKFITVKKTRKTNSYAVAGKSMVKTNICDFKGTINITNIRRFNVIATGVDGIYKNKGIKGQFSIVGDYLFAETKGQSHSGVFKGSFTTDFYVDKNNKIVYDDIDINADGYTNNEFVGNWTMYDSNFTQRCNWGDYRIPNCGDLDIGAGEFSPNDKYLKNGWQIIRDAYTGSTPSSKVALKAEKTKWWE
jgi:hypothetical protein